MNIGITCYPTVGGSGAVAAELGKQLARRGHTVHFVSYRLPFRLGDFQQNIGFHEVDVSSYVLFEYPPHDLALAAKMAEVARDHHLDLFHVHYAIPHAITGLLAQQMLGADAPKLVTTLHGTDVTLVGQDRSFFEITRFGIERSNGVTAVSEFLRKMTIDEFQVRNGIEVIHNFIDLSEYSPNRAYKDRAAFAKPEEKILLHISNFRPVKRVLDVVRILERVTREVPTVLLMVGEGPERSSAQALARRLGLQDRVRFLGTQESIEQIAGMADVLLLPSESSPSGCPRSRPWRAACRSSDPTRAACPKSCSTRRPDTSCRWGTSRGWRRAPSRSSNARSGAGRWGAPAGVGPRRSSGPSAS